MKTNPNDFAYPTEPCTDEVFGGLTKREYFAIHALYSLKGGGYGSFSDMAIDAVQVADALIAELNKEDEN